MEKAQKLSIEELKNIPETLLYPLKARYIETKKKDGVISDPLSVKILDALHYDSSQTKITIMPQLGMCLRTIIFDQQVNRFLAKNPDGVVVNIACGLDTRFPRVDNGKVRWFDLDLPEAIAVRRHFFQETDRHRFVAKSALDPSWADEIPKDKKALFLIEGLSMYFSEEENRAMLKIIRDNFTGSECLIEILAGWFVKMTAKSASKKTYDDPLENKIKDMVKWGVDSGRELDGWFAEMNFIEEFFVTKQRPDAFPFWFRICCFLLPAVSRVNKVVHLRFA
ncbi:MAG: class I SAM-dependent methyltransferase [Deltaproteobacteria bacterium]|nr:class I SAM-dependent methyltransferase [Deltaproteobacteria bacterium]